MNRKYLVILGDGMADRPLDSLDGMTPLMVAHKPNIDWLASHGEIGLCHTIPDGMKPGSDVANLSVIGYDPLVYYTGRSPLEAMSIGVDFSPIDVTYRCNLVTISSEPDIKDTTLVDYSAGEISTEEAESLIQSLKDAFDSDTLAFYRGVSYRHCLLLRKAKEGAILTPPHDITGKKVAEYLPDGTNSELLYDLMRKARAILESHPINKERVRLGKNPANCIWLWGEGRKPNLTEFAQKTGLKGAMISAVDLLKGIGKVSGMTVYDVEGATGTIHTNFDGKANACIDAFESGHDYVYMHLEAPDECGHQGDLEGKIKLIELIDDKIVAPILKYLSSQPAPYTILVCPDHPTPISIRTHSADAIPYIIYRSDVEIDTGLKYDEYSATSTLNILPHGYDLISKMLGEEV